MFRLRISAPKYCLLASLPLAVAAVLPWVCGQSTQPTADQARLVSELASVVRLSRDAARPARVAIFHPRVPGLSATPKLGAPFNNRTECVWAPVTPEEIRAGKLRDFDVVVFPGGSGSRHAALLREAGRRSVSEFVAAGGGYVGICAGAFLASANYDWSLAIIDAKTITGMRDVGSDKPLRMAMRGSADVEIEFTEAGRQVFGEVPSRVEMAYSDGPILSPAGRADLGDYVCLATYRGEVCQHKVQRGTMVGTPAIVAGRFGAGRVILFSPHPEKSPGLASLLVRAVVAAARGSEAPPALETAISPRRREGMQCRR